MTHNIFVRPNLTDSQINLPHGTQKKQKKVTKRTKSKKNDLLRRNGQS